MTAGKPLVMVVIPGLGPLPQGASPLKFKLNLGRKKLMQEISRVMATSVLDSWEPWESKDGERERKSSMWVVAEDEKEKRQNFCLTSSGARESKRQSPE